MKDYSSENVKLLSLCSLSADEAEKLIGKTIAKVYGREYGLTLTFTDGSELEVSGSTYGECSLDANYSSKEELS